jgi:hypothetical protein
MQQEKDDEFERTMARRMHGKGWRDDRERGENDMIKFNSKKKNHIKKGMTRTSHILLGQEKSNACSQRKKL